MNNTYAQPADNRRNIQSTPICYRCSKAVYAVEQTGPINNGAIFHKNCFRCVECSHNLTATNYQTNQVNNKDKEVYCRKHAPLLAGHAFDANALGIQNALKVQSELSQEKLEAQKNKLRDRPTAVDENACYIRNAIEVSNMQASKHDKMQDSHIDKNAMFIQGPLAATQKFKNGPKAQLSQHSFHPLLLQNRQELYMAQERLEKLQRQEEDALMRKFQQERELKGKEIKDETEQEWEIKLRELTQKFESELSRKKNRIKEPELKAMTLKFETDKKRLHDEIQEQNRAKLQTATLKMREKQQDMTSDMVKRHSQQMLTLIASMEQRIAKKIQQELASTKAEPAQPKEPATVQRLPSEIEQLVIDTSRQNESRGDENIPPGPPSCHKMDLFTDPSIFSDLDEHVISIAEYDQESFTELVQNLCEPCTIDLQRVRAIFRWITVKDLNVIKLPEGSDDSPLGLLRGIKSGTETYHALFARLCSYAGIPCIEVKGHSKSVGYEPGMRIEKNTFLNTWNCVLVDGDWRLIQCNWGARHLVLNKDKNVASRKDTVRYQYDEHYFLTDPEEFIQEFWPFDNQWQLLKEPITLRDFQELPFVRSIFFQYGMQFVEPYNAIVQCSQKGGVEVKIKVDEHLANSIVFHCQLRFADKAKNEQSHYQSFKLERFVFQAMDRNQVMFSVYVPTPAHYFLEIFANHMDSPLRFGEQQSSAKPFRLKCACKFKLICERLSFKMHPLPDCATGEWGPQKARRHFGIEPLSHKTGVAKVVGTADIKFKVNTPLVFAAKLRSNMVESATLEDFIDISTRDGILSVKVAFAQAGQYGLDIYARPEKAENESTLSHACKYLLNVTKPAITSNPQAQQQIVPKPAKETPPPRHKKRLGPRSNFKRLGLETISHSDPLIETSSPNVKIQVSLTEPLYVSYQLIEETNGQEIQGAVTLTTDGKRTLSLLVRLEKEGGYILNLFARKTTEDKSSATNVFVYRIIYRSLGARTGVNV